MANVANSFLQPLDKGSAGDVFDRNHAHRIFVGNTYRLAPKYSFLYHVFFERDKSLSLIQDNESLEEVGLMVKSVTLPKYTVDNKTLNAYNRPNIVQTKVKYDPITITFHDDGFGKVLDFWRDYFNYYYRDADYYSAEDDSDPVMYHESHKYSDNAALRQKSWGYTIRYFANVTNFLKNIRIYSMNQGTFTEYILVNPFITSFQHGTHVAGENATMEHTMTVAYEAVLYYSGYVRDDTMPGFANLYYDKRPSPLAPKEGRYSSLAVGGAPIGRANGTWQQRPRPFGARGVLGAGGILDTSNQVLGDIRTGNFGGALVKGWKSYQNNKNANLELLLRGEAKTRVINGILTGTNPFAGISIPGVDRIPIGPNQPYGRGVGSTRYDPYLNNNNGLVNPNSNLQGLQNTPIRYQQSAVGNYNNFPGEFSVTSNNSNLGLTGLASAALGIAALSNRDNIGVVAVAALGAAALASPRNKLPLDTPNGTVQNRTNVKQPYSLIPANNPTRQPTNQLTAGPFLTI